MKYHVHITTYEELENTLNQLPKNEEIFTINAVGTQAAIITEEKTDEIEKAEESIKTRQRLLETMRAKKG